jgi:hypothetical protein
MDDVPFGYCVHDYRTKKDLKSGTLTGYKRNEVLKAMSKAIINSKIEEACRWGVELHVSGYTDYIFDELFITYINFINISNPYYLFYFLRRKKYYYELIYKIPKKIIIFTRNNQEIRNLICELITILVYSKKNNLFQSKGLPKIPVYAYEYKYVQRKVISSNTHNIMKYLDDGDLTEIKIALNEVINILYSGKRTFYKIVFWYLWLKKFIKEYKKTNIKREISKRYDIDEIQEKYKNDWVWSLWKIILDYTLHKNKVIKQYIIKLYYEYRNKYKGYERGDKNSILMYVLYILTTDINFNINIRQNERNIIQTNCLINSIYLTIEKSLIRNYSSEQEKERHNIYEEIIMNENVKLKKKVEKEIQKKHELKKKISNEKNLKRLESFRDFIPYKKLEKEKKQQYKNVSDYFNNETNKKIIKIQNNNNNNNGPFNISLYKH